VTVALLVLQLVTLLVIVSLLGRLRRQHARAVRAEQLIAATEALDLDPAILATSDRIITVEILNPLEVAAKRVKLASVVGSVAPSVIAKVVYEQTAKILRNQLSLQGVAAEVRLHAGD
jgi:hypothetical protein